MKAGITTAHLEAFLDDALENDELARVEQVLRSDPALQRALAAVRARRDSGLHSLGEVWRRRRLSCPSRDELGSYLLGAATPATSYVAFHLDQVGCRVCRANLDDLRRQQAEAPEAATSRCRRFFQSSAGYLRRE